MDTSVISALVTFHRTFFYISASIYVVADVWRDFKFIEKDARGFTVPRHLSKSCVVCVDRAPLAILCPTAVK